MSNPDGTLQSELDFRGEEDVKHHVIKMDEANHNLSITGNNGGSRAVTTSMQQEMEALYGPFKSATYYGCGEVDAGE